MGGHEPTHLGAKELFVDYAPFVARFLARIGVRPADIDDRVQEVFLVVHRKGGFRSGDARPTTWLARIAIRVASTARRTARRHPEHPDDVLAEHPGERVDPYRSAEVSEALVRVERALEALELGLRAVFVLSEIEGETCEAIARGLRIPLGTVHSRLHRARKDFRGAYEHALRAPAPAVRMTDEEPVCR
jgi:RNA polymerase sigma-70 factor, ECF subfamily